MNRRLIFIPLILIAGGILIAAKWWRADSKQLTASGTLEARNIEVGSKVGGRILRVLAQEGDLVQPNQLLVLFDSDQLEGRLLQARGHYAAAKANYDKLLRGNRPEEVMEARAGTQDRAAELSRARSELDRAKAESVNAESNYARYKKLADDGVVSRQQLDDASMRRDAAKAAVESAEHSIHAAEKLMQASAAVQQRTEKGFRVEEIAAAKAELTRSEGELKEAEAQFAEREVRSPATAVIEAMDIRPGNLVAADTRIARLLEADQLFVMVYVPQDRIGQVRVGQKANLTVDAFPKTTFSATIEQIRQKAEFLPRNVQTAEEREHQVIGVKLRVDNHENKLRAGIHADVRFAEAN
ncbi:MAG: putative efflux pump rane fusion protein [Acidobacteriales bacterium]|nr:putative efflux pump rane fusion protein [Terriglobales bacterium]